MNSTINIDLKGTIETTPGVQHLGKNSLKKATESFEPFSQTPSRRQIEKTLLDYIAFGNVALAEQFLLSAANNNQLSFDMGKLSVNTLQQARFAIVASITLFCRTAIDCGLPESLAYSISDIYIQHLSCTNDENKIYSLFIQAFLEYCQAIQNWKLSDCNSQLKPCVEYIMAHLNTKITMEDLGKASSLSPNYVSDLFKKELGIRPMHYIRQEKLKYATYLLRNSHMSITDIAEYLAFPSTSAFSSQFREVYGITPNHYRNGKK